MIESVPQPGGHLSAAAISDSTELPAGAKALLGTNKELMDKDLNIDTIIQDLNDTENKTSMDIIIGGGVKDRTWKLGPIPVDEGGVIKYSARIGFFKKLNPAL